MANIKSAAKRIEISERNRLRNKAYKSTVKTLIKKTMLAITTSDEPNSKSIQELLSSTYSKIDKAVQKGILHCNNGNAKKARLSKYLKAQENKATK